MTFLSYFLAFLPLVLTLLFICAEQLFLKKAGSMTVKILLTVFIFLSFIAWVACDLILYFACGIDGGWRDILINIGFWSYFIYTSFGKKSIYRSITNTNKDHK